MNNLRKAPFYITKLLRRKPIGFVKYSKSCAEKNEDDDCPNLKDKILRPLVCKPAKNNNKVTILGAGSVGAASAFCILAKRIASEVVLFDKNKKKLMAEVEDLQQGSLYLKDAKITAAEDYCCTANSRVCVITCGAAQTPDQNRLDLKKTNAEVMKCVVPKFVETSPDSIIIMVTNPCDIMTYVALKLSCFPPNQCFGSGTILDSSRFRYFLSQRFQIAPSACKGMVLGEHGDSSVSVWSGVNVGGVRLFDLDPCIGREPDPLAFEKVHQEVVNAGPKLLLSKGYTNWAIGLCVSRLVNAVLRNQNTVIPVSVNAKGFYGIKRDVCLSLPCVINASGASIIVRQKLKKIERKQLQKSAEILYKARKGIKL